MSDTITNPDTVAMEKQAIALAQTTATAILSAPDGAGPKWAKPALAIGYMVVFISMVIVAYATHDQAMIALLGGAVIGMASQAGSYYFGSSSESAHKSNLLAAAAPINPVTTK